MTTAAPALTTVSAGALVAIHVQGLPHSSKTDNVLTYRAHRDLDLDDLVLVETPAWAVRVTGREFLPGFVLGPTDPAALGVLDESAIKSTLPLPPEPLNTLNGDTAATIESWSRQAQALEEAAGHIKAAITMLRAAEKG
jgi:hypothetical protein